MLTDAQSSALCTQTVFVCLRIAQSVRYHADNIAIARESKHRSKHQQQLYISLIQSLVTNAQPILYIITLQTFAHDGLRNTVRGPCHGLLQEEA